MYKVSIDGNNKFPLDCWSLSDPDGYVVNKCEPCKKSLNESYTAEIIKIIILLNQTKLIDWVASNAYDSLWTYIKGFFSFFPKNSEAKVLIKIKNDSEEFELSMCNIGDRDFNLEKNDLKLKITAKK